MNNPIQLNSEFDDTVVSDSGLGSLESAEADDEERQLPQLTPACSTDTHCVGLGLLPRGSAPGHHRLYDGHPALFVWETGSHEVNRLSRPAGGVTTRLQLQDIRDI